jgi:hypothetical protein
MMTFKRNSAYVRQQYRRNQVPTCQILRAVPPILMTNTIRTGPTVLLHNRYRSNFHEMTQYLGTTRNDQRVNRVG